MVNPDSRPGTSLGDVTVKLTVEELVSAGGGCVTTVLGDVLMATMGSTTGVGSSLPA